VKRKLSYCIGLGVAVSLAVAAAGTPAPTSHEHVVIGFASPILAGVPDQQAFLLGQQKAAKMYGWKVVPLDAQLSTDKQIQDIDTFISQKVQGVTTAALDPKGMEPVFLRARKAGIPVIGLLSSSPTLAGTIFQDNYAANCKAQKDAAAYMAKRVPGSKVLVMAGAPVPILLQMAKCFEKAAEAAGLQVVGRKDNVKDTAAYAQQITTDLITKNPDVKGMWVNNDQAAVGAAAALRAAGMATWSGSKQGVVLIAGCCGSKLGIDAIKNGTLTAEYDVRSLEAGAAAIAAFGRVYVKHRPLSAIPKIIHIPWQRWDAANVSKWIPQDRRPLAKWAKVK
jgi:ABC-type sugar transport system substrate-binding protein